MRPFLAALTVVAVALMASASASARTSANCQTTFTKGPSRYLVIGAGVGCRTAVPMARALVTAPVIGRVRRGGVTLLRLRPPTAGWTCATTSPVRTVGAGCAKGALAVSYVKVA